MQMAISETKFKFILIIIIFIFGYVYKKSFSLDTKSNKLNDYLKRTCNGFFFLILFIMNH